MLITLGDNGKSGRKGTKQTNTPREKERVGGKKGKGKRGKGEKKREKGIHHNHKSKKYLTPI